MPKEPLFFKILIDDKLEVLKWLGAKDRCAVDQKCRCAGDTNLAGQRRLFLYIILVFARIEALVKSFTIKTQLFGVFF